jgi:hypothetical protein
MKRDPDFFEGTEPVLVYIAKKLREALRLESLLTAEGVDYGVEADRYYRAGIIFQGERIGAFFYVLPETEEQARRVMLANGYKPHVSEPRR